MTKAAIEARAIRKCFGRDAALEDVSVSVRHGELMALLGPSGSGKTTLLRIIAGLEAADAGTVYYAGEDVTLRPVRQRNVGFVFQHYALFEHLDVFENVAFGLRVRRVPDDEVQRRVSQLLDLIRLSHLARRLPAQLSGGQRQRVALARALAPSPKLLLLDEPFGALDAKVRQELRDWLRRIHGELDVTSLFVTHDQEEAFEIADRVVVMNGGRVVQVGTPEQVYEEPADAFVVDFLGKANRLHGEVRGGVGHFLGLQVACSVPDGPAEAWLRHSDLDVSAQPGLPGASMPGRITRMSRIGPIVRLELHVEGLRAAVGAEVSPDHATALALRHGDTVHLAPRRVRVYPAPAVAPAPVAAAPRRAGLRHLLRGLKSRPA